MADERDNDQFGEAEGSNNQQFTGQQSQQNEFGQQGQQNEQSAFSQQGQEQPGYGSQQP